MIENVNQALTLFMYYLKNRGFTVKRAIPTNFKRHYMIIAEHWRNPKKTYKFYLAYQREWFMAMPKIYGNTDSVGATLNKSILLELVKQGYNYIIFVHKDGSFLTIKPEDMLAYAIENGWIRKTKRTNEEVVNIPISLLNPIKVRKYA